MKKIVLEPQWLDAIRNIVREITACPTYLFGSRVSGTPRRYSDVDLCIKNDRGLLPLHIIGELQERFEESNIPYIIDCSDYFRLPIEIREVVDNTGVLVNDTKN